MTDDTQLDKEDAERFRWIQQRLSTFRNGDGEVRYYLNARLVYGRDFREAIDNTMERAKQEGGK